MSLRDTPLAPLPGQREPHLVLHAEDQRISGYLGCNLLRGRYVLSGENLDLSHAGRTMMACETGMELEQRFYELLPRVASWRIRKDTLELRDAAGELLMRLEAAYRRGSAALPWISIATCGRPGRSTASARTWIGRRNDTVVKGGGVPMVVLARTVAAFVGSR